MEQAQEKCPVCADGIPIKDYKTSECPKCGRKVRPGMIIQSNKAGQPVWDYPKTGKLP
jgi:predicted RNA-binding Zn-ribbon protein involved in translation (DUF1610 family)